MLKPRYYYSSPGKIADATVIVDENGSLIYTYDDYRYKKPMPRLTVCGIWDTEANTMSFGVARCSEKDTFEKAIGRSISHQRASEDPCKVVHIDKLDKVSDIFMMVAENLEDEYL